MPTFKAPADQHPLVTIEITDAGLKAEYNVGNWIESYRPGDSNPAVQHGFTAWKNGVLDGLNNRGIPTAATIGPFALPQPPAPGASPVEAPAPLDPRQILQDIVNAINGAESTLNLQNFIIATGSITAKLALPAGGVDITFQITPKPYA